MGYGGPARQGQQSQQRAMPMGAQQQQQNPWQNGGNLDIGMGMPGGWRGLPPPPPPPQSGALFPQQQRYFQPQPLQAPQSGQQWLSGFQQQPQWLSNLLASRAQGNPLPAQVQQPASQPTQQMPTSGFGGMMSRVVAQALPSQQPSSPTYNPATQTYSQSPVQQTQARTLPYKLQDSYDPIDNFTVMPYARGGIASLRIRPGKKRK